jgi:NAD-dependent DNA ligase
MAEHSDLDANVVVELALNKVVELQRQIILTDAKYVTLRQDYDRVVKELQSLQTKFNELDTDSSLTRKTATK